MNDSMLRPSLSCPNNIKEGVTHESFSKAITNDMALAISYCMGTKISV